MPDEIILFAAAEPGTLGSCPTPKRVSCVDGPRLQEILIGEVQSSLAGSGRDTGFILRPPHRTVRAAFPHTAPTSGEWRRSGRSAKDGG